MKIFVSWSGKASHELAQAFKEWIPQVLNLVEVWISSTDIDKGALWASELFEALGECRYGIVCVTPEALGSSYLMFEVGALAKAIPDAAHVKARVVPILFGIQYTGLIGTPLTHFQPVEELTQSAMLNLLGQINGLLDKPRSEAQLKEAVETWWPKFEERLKQVQKTLKTERVAAPPPNSIELLEEILSSVRSQERRLDALSFELVPTQANLPATQSLSERTREIEAAAMEIGDVLIGDGYDVSYMETRSNGDIVIGVDRAVTDLDLRSRVSAVVQRAQGKLRGGGSKLRVVYVPQSEAGTDGGDVEQS